MGQVWRQLRSLGDARERLACPLQRNVGTWTHVLSVVSRVPPRVGGRRSCGVFGVGRILGAAVGATLGRVFAGGTGTLRSRSRTSAASRSSRARRSPPRPVPLLAGNFRSSWTQKRCVVGQSTNIGRAKGATHSGHATRAHMTLGRTLREHRYALKFASSGRSPRASPQDLSSHYFVAVAYAGSAPPPSPPPSPPARPPPLWVAAGPRP